jgi:membrane fusion protein, multidrug efflux system
VKSEPSREERANADPCQPGGFGVGAVRAYDERFGRAVYYSDLLFRIPPPEDEKKPNANTQDQVISIQAPFDGVIARLTRQPGCFVWKDDFLTTVVQTSVIWAYFKVPEKDYLEAVTEWSRDQQSQQVKLILADQSDFPHGGQSTGPLGGSNSDRNHIPFLAKFPNPDGLLRSGQSGTVSVSREWKDTILLPRRATFADQVARYVYVVDEGQVVHRRAIVIADGTEDLVVVKHGVGDTIVADEVGQIRDGEKVE